MNSARWQNKNLYCFFCVLKQIVFPKIIYQLSNFQICYQANRMLCEVTEINEIMRVEL